MVKVNPDIEMISFAQDRVGARLVQLFAYAMQCISMAVAAGMTKLQWETKARNYLNKPEMKVFRESLRNALVLVAYKPVGKRTSSEYIELRHFVQFFLYFAGWLKAPQRMPMPNSLAITNIIDPRTTFDFQLASSFVALLNFMVQVTIFGAIREVNGEYSVRKLIFGSGNYARICVAERCLDELSKIEFIAYLHKLLVIVQNAFLMLIVSNAFF